MTDNTKTSTPMKVLVISSYELGRQPQSVAEVQNLVESLGHRVSVLDLSLPDDMDRQLHQASNDLLWPEGSYADLTKAFADTDLFLLSTPMLTAATMAKRLVKAISKANPAAKIAAFGLYSDIVLTDSIPHIDAAMTGEYLPLIEEWLAAGLPSNHRATSNRPSRHSTNTVIERTSLPPISAYPGIVVDGVHKLVGHVESTRGCRHSCLHCPVPTAYHGRIQINPVDTILTDIRGLLDQGATHITFGDPDFLNAPIHASKIIEGLDALSSEDISFDATIKVEHILKYPSLIEKMAASGCSMITSAVESLNDEVLSRLDKGHTAEQAYEATEIVQKLGITLHPSFLPFTPWTTNRDLADIVDYCYHFGLEEVVEPVQFGIRLLLPPGSLLLSSENRDFEILDYDPTTMGYRWQHSDRRIDELAIKVASLAEEATYAKQSNLETLHAIRHIAYQFIDKVPPAITRGTTIQSSTKLAEPWFC